MITLIALIGFIALLVSVVYYGAIPVSRLLVEKQLFFFSPKKGSIVAAIKNNRVFGYFGNLFDEGKYVVKKTGEIKSIWRTEEINGKLAIVEDIENKKEFDKQVEEKNNSIMWKWLGCKWLGMGKLFNYQFSKGVPAESIYLKNVVTLLIPDLLTKEQSKVSLLVIFSLETKNAAKSLNYKDGAWMEYVQAAIKSVCREYVGEKSYIELSPEKVEHKSKQENGLLKMVLSLNDSDIGNVGLIDEVGQKVVSFRLEKVVIDEELEKAGEAVMIAKKNAEAAIKNAETIVTNAEAEAKRITGIGNAENGVLVGRAAIVGPVNAANIEIAEQLKEALAETHVQAVSFGNGGTPFILNGEKSKIITVGGK